MTKVTREIAEKFASLALAHVAREYPSKLDHVLAGPEDVLGPRALHPIFFGSFDWHSCVHGYWLLARLLRRYPDLRRGPRITELLDECITPANVETERAYVARPASRGFERPYGWAWLLALQAELELHADGAGRRAAANLRPLAQAFARRFTDFLPLCDYPVRAGVHSSTAFALRLAADYAEPFDVGLFALMQTKARQWYEHDAGQQVREPSQDDFLSPSLMEAECMRRYLALDEFRTWFGLFLPHVAEGEPQALFHPVCVSDRTDGKIAHLDGLNFSRAWCWRAIADALTDEARARSAREAAERHIEASLPHVAGDYSGEHWLATFAMLALDGC